MLRRRPKMDSRVTAAQRMVSSPKGKGLQDGVVPHKLRTLYAQRLRSKAARLRGGRRDDQRPRVYRRTDTGGS